MDHQKPQAELDSKACAAVRQNGLMALYDTLFSQVDQWFIIGPSSSFIRCYGFDCSIVSVPMVRVGWVSDLGWFNQEGNQDLQAILDGDNLFVKLSYEKGIVSE
ncbi:putative glutamate-5-semialdehyde dehydrogenase, Glutamate 5-kinase [Helianthus debilis subsp. tardiflorus]